jgi:hypothetical protein
MTLVPEDKEHCADILDVAANVTTASAAVLIANASALAAPEQDGTVTECEECGSDLGDRALIFKIRCIPCQERLEKRRAGYGMGRD